MKFVDTDCGVFPIADLGRIADGKNGPMALLESGREVALRQEVVDALTSQLLPGGGTALLLWCAEEEAGSAPREPRREDVMIAERTIIGWQLHPLLEPIPIICGQCAGDDDMVAIKQPDGCFVVPNDACYPSREAICAEALNRAQRAWKRRAADV